MKEYLKEVSEVLADEKTGKKGLTSEEAQKRLAANGSNKLNEAKKEGFIKKFLKGFTDPMIIVLIAAAVISAFTAAYAHESYADVIIIMIVVILNALLGAIQENKAEKAIDALKEMTAATSHVIRDGKSHTVKSEDLTVGDVLILEAGDAVGADARVTMSAGMKIEEAALTGESVAVSKTADKLDLEDRKDIPLGDRKNMVYMGSTVVYGRGRAVVTATGMDTEMGKIADALEKAQDEVTPLQKKMAQLSKILSILIIIICVFIFAVNMFRIFPNFNTKAILNTFMIAVSLAVAAIPEGLAAVVTIVLSIGVTNMSKHSAVIRKLTAVETLGCTQIICSDKTGTLTQNVMTVTEHTGDDADELATAMALCSDAVLDDNNKAKGEPTECALVNFAYNTGVNKTEAEKEYPRIGEAPFDSMRKMMSTVHTCGDGFVQFTKGAPDVILSHCTKILVNGETVALTDEMRNDILRENKAMADKALRVLCGAKRDWVEKPANFDADYLENDLTYLGLCGMIDPIRPEVKDSIKECREAGIRPIMITGDHKDTAVAIAKELGIISSADEAITGAQLDEITDDELDEYIEKYSVYARVQPEHKVRIVNAWKKKDKVTAMTGDGVNDAPSIKNADIGVGMGITGTDVTKNVADMVLADDNFATIVSAVEEGRHIYDNIRKAIQFLLSSNLAEVLAIFIASLLGFTILRPVHLLWINLITDCFPALALGLEKSEKNIMKREPRDTSDSIFAGGMGFDIAIQGTIITLLTLAAYFIGHYMEHGVWEIAESPDGITMAFITLSMVEIFHSFNMRSRRNSVFGLGGPNKYLWGAAILSLICTTAVIYIPFFSTAFQFTEISIKEYFTALGLAFMIIPIMELVKLIQRAVSKRRK